MPHNRPAKLWVGSLSTLPESLREIIEATKQNNAVAVDPASAAVKLNAAPFDCVCGLPGAAEWELDLLHAVQRVDRTVPVVFYNPQGSFTQSIRLVGAGALAYVTDTLSAERLLELLVAAAATKSHSHRNESAEKAWRGLLIGDSRPLEAVRDIIRMVGDRRSTVLITGETGTGKELAARSVHLASDRRQREMVNVNCTALPEHLLEAELFGHTRGAFTGAVTNRVGRFEQAHLSTIFLDEIGDMPLDIQAKLLRVLQERELQRIGSSDTLRVDVRVLAASNTNLRRAVSERRFREDLLYRLRVVELHMPALRERLSDIPLLLEHFIAKICNRESMAIKRFEPAVIDHLSAHSWPGNVRELEHSVESAVVLSGERRLLCVKDFQIFQSHETHEGALLELPETGVDLDGLLSGLESTLLNQALRKSGGNKARAADMLRIPRTTLISKVKALSLAS